MTFNAPVVAVALAAALLCAVATVPAAMGSLAEDATHGVVSYQFDGGTHHDAPDACSESDPAWNVTLGKSTDGVLAPPDDLSDVFTIDVPRSAIGQRLFVHAAEAKGTPEVAARVWAPGCLGDVFELLNQPHAPPAPPAPQTGERQVVAPNLRDPWGCSQAWTFLLSGGRDATLPDSIHVAWTNGAERSLSLWGQSHGWAAYRSTDDLGTLLHGAWANVPQAWDGKFALATGPCDAQDGGVVYGDPPMQDGGGVWFTPIRAGAHLIQVTWTGALAPLPTSFPMSCHGCADEAEEVVDLVSYELTVHKAPSAA